MIASCFYWSSLRSLCCLLALSVAPRWCCASPRPTVASIQLIFWALGRPTISLGAIMRPNSRQLTQMSRVPRRLNCHSQPTRGQMIRFPWRLSILLMRTPPPERPRERQPLDLCLPQPQARSGSLSLRLLPLRQPLRQYLSRCPLLRVAVRWLC